MEKKIIAEFLKKDLNHFNGKTAGLEEYRKIIQHQAIFKDHRKLSFLPSVFHDFVEIYLKFPDHYIKIHPFNHYRMQYYENLLHKDEILYSMFYREIFINMDKKTITLQWSKTRNLFAVKRSQYYLASEPPIVWKSFTEALKEFYKN